MTAHVPRPGSVPTSHCVKDTGKIKLDKKLMRMYPPPSPCSLCAVNRFGAHEAGCLMQQEQHMANLL